MPDKHLLYHYPSSAPLRLMMGSFLCAQTKMPFAAIQPNELACRNSTGDYVNLPVCWGVWLEFSTIKKINQNKMEALSTTNIVIGAIAALFTIVLTYYKIIKVRRENKGEKPQTDVAKKVTQENEKGTNRAEIKSAQSLEGNQKNKEGDNIFIEN